MATALETDRCDDQTQMKNLSIKEWMKSNDISLLPDTYDKLTEHGFNKMYVHNYVLVHFKGYDL